MNAAARTNCLRVTIAASSLLSCLVFYPFVHECGHLIPAVIGGASVNRFVWTPLIGPPHVGLSNVSGEALPWVDAGGILLPTIVGTALLCVWLILPAKAPYPIWRLWLLIPGVVMLAGNLGLVYEATLDTDSYCHMILLAKMIAGGNETLAKGVELLPVVWAIVLFGVVIHSSFCRSSTA